MVLVEQLLVPEIIEIDEYIEYSFNQEKGDNEDGTYLMCL